MFKGKVVAFALMVLFATSVYAGDVDDCRSTAGISPCTTMMISICPAADFELWNQACGGNDAYVWVIARDSGSNPIPGIPWSDYWLNACDEDDELFLCANPIGADSLTGPDGRTTFSASTIRGGGCNANSDVAGIWWAIQGKTLHTPPCPSVVKLCLSIIVKSPDLMGGSSPDGIINILDLDPFASSYHKNLGDAGFNPCCDYNDDNKCDIADFAFFGSHYQHRCPA